MARIVKNKVLISTTLLAALFIVCMTALTGCGGGSGGGATAVPTYTVTYNGNGNTGGIVPTDSTGYQQGQTVTVLGNTDLLVKTGSAFAGWNTAADGSGTTYAQAQTFTMGNVNVTLYAKWTANPTYVVTYDGNGNTGGTVPVDTTNYQQGDTVTVLGNTYTLVKAGYSYSGWNTAADGSGTTYTQTETFTMGSANVTLYAKWTTNPTYVVTYDGNGNTGGTVPVDTTNYQQGDTVTVLGDTGNLVRTGYAFTGWNTLANGTGTTYAAAETFAMGPASVTLYAKWSPTYTVTYNGNGSTGGTVPVDPLSYLPSESVVVSANTGSLVRTAYTFAGWNTAANGSGTSYAASGSATFTMGSADVTLYAQWTALPTYTVTYNGNDNTIGSVPTDSSNYLAGATVTVKANTGALAKTNAAFAGWNTAADGSGTDYAASGSATFTMGSADVILYAKWTDFTVPFVTTAATTSIQGTMVTSGGTITGTGGAAVTARGLVWSLSSNPSATGWSSSNGTGTGSFTHVITGLNLNTTYYVRAFATNSVGTAYGDMLSFTTAATYSYGDTGPGGGLVFYDRGVTAGSWQYLEAATSDQGNDGGIPGSAPFWGNTTPSLVTGATISTGASNTATIYAQWGASNSYAVGRCVALNLGAMTDWFLPSKDELDQMWLNLGAAGMGSFSSGYYWSSTQALTTTDAWSQSMVNGGLQTYPKDWGYVNTRCVRQF